MKLVFYSPAFYPLVGGLEGFVEDLSFSLANKNVEVTLLTTTSYDKQDNYPFKIIRNPSLHTTIKEIQSADYYVQFNVSLKGLPAWILSGCACPLVLVHQNIVSNGFREKIKQFVADNWAKLNIGCSEYIARHYKKSLAIHNAYNHLQFYETKKWSERQNELLYVGRLVSDKGCDTLLNALYLLKNDGIVLKLNIIGKGVEEDILRGLTKKMGLENQVTFWGQKPRVELNTIMNDHKLLIVPSRYEEPFGIVALEGLAAGCFTIVTEYGGLREAIGKCGFTFPNGDAVALAETIKRAYANKTERDACFAAVPKHLAEHTQDSIAQKYLDVLTELSSKGQASVLENKSFRQTSILSQ